MPSWDVVLDEDVEDWLMALEEPLYERVATAIDMLAEMGPALGRPLVDQITSSRHPNMKELRVATARILFAFDPRRRAVLLVAGDKSGKCNAWYPPAIEEADKKFDALLKEMNPMADRRIQSWASVKEQRPVAPERSKELREQLEAEVLAYRLAELRKELHKSQASVGAAMGVSQRRVSAIEHGDVERAELSTIRSYIGALGGTVKIVADFGDRYVVLE